VGLEEGTLWGLYSVPTGEVRPERLHAGRQSRKEKPGAAGVCGKLGAGLAFVLGGEPGQGAAPQGCQMDEV
jgi:hypothetical protein